MSANEPVPPPPANILAVDDTPANLQLLVGLLKEHGYRVRPVPSGVLALQAAEASQPDLILLDITMPEMNGYEVCRRLKENPRLRDIPVLFISAMNEPLDKVRAFQTGGVDYVTKPFHAEEVEARVRTHLTLRQQQKALAESLAKQEEMERMRDSLTHMIVHDMRSPLAVLQVACDLLGTEFLAGDGDAQAILVNARGSLSTLTEMVTQMLDLSRLESGQMQLDRQPVDLADLARAAVDGVRPLLEQRQVTVTAPAAVVVHVDPHIVRRVIGNLLGNALKFSADDGSVDVRVMEGPEGARLEVIDYGPGIAPEHHAKVFEKFGQIAGAKRHMGSGLGLTFCKLAVEAHGGRIGLTSELGKGCTFWFSLPL